MNIKLTALLVLDALVDSGAIDLTPEERDRAGAYVLSVPATMPATAEAYEAWRESL